LRGARRHEPRRLALAVRDGRSRADLRSGARSRTHRRTAAEARAAAPHALDADRSGPVMPRRIARVRKSDAPRATRNRHPATASRTGHPARASRRGPAARQPVPTIRIPRDVDDVALEVQGRQVTLTNLRKVFWPDLGITKGDLLQYYATAAWAVLPHVRDRAMV